MRKVIYTILALLFAITCLAIALDQNQIAEVTRYLENMAVEIRPTSLASLFSGLKLF